jgi:hypothetical protein
VQKNASRQPAALFLTAGSKAKQAPLSLIQEGKEDPEAKKCLVCHSLITNATEGDVLCAGCTSTEEDASRTTPLLTTAGSKAEANAEVKAEVKAEAKDCFVGLLADPPELLNEQDPTEEKPEVKPEEKAEETADKKAHTL